MYTTASSPNSRTSSDTGRSMPTSSSPSAALRRLRWSVCPGNYFATTPLILSRSTSAAYPASHTRSISGQTTATSRWTRVTTTTSLESEYSLSSMALGNKLRNGQTHVHCAIAIHVGSTAEILLTALPVICSYHSHSQGSLSFLYLRSSPTA
jgi:hypothetical protein